MSQEKKEKKINVHFEKYFVVVAISLLVYKLTCLTSFEQNINLTYNKNSVIMKTHMGLKRTLDEDFQGGSKKVQQNETRLKAINWTQDL
jgi:hypothetical protein